MFGEYRMCVVKRTDPAVGIGQAVVQGVTPLRLRPDRDYEPTNQLKPGRHRSSAPSAAGRAAESIHASRGPRNR